MIIDIHTHIAYSKLYPDTYLTGMLSDFAAVDQKKLSALLTIALRDKFCERQLSEMDDAGIEKSVLLIIDGELGMGRPSMSIEDIYLLHYEVLLKFPNRFVVFAGVDPRRGDKGLILFRRSIEEYGFKGIKLYPPMGFSPSDKRLYEYYMICEEKGLTALIHTGPSLKGLNNEMAEPKYIYQVALDFPNVNFILAHAGYRLSNPSLESLIDLPNIYVDIAGFQAVSKGDEILRMKELELIFTEKYNKKVLFGSDWPLFNVISPLKNHVELLTDLFFQSKDLTQDSLQNIFYNNALKALRL